MRAVTVNHFGECPQLREVTTPSAGPGQLLIRLAAAGVNPIDVKLASGEWRPAPAIFPMVLGIDGAGVIEAIGEGTTRFLPGDQVFGQFFLPPVGVSGTYAEYVAVTSEMPLARLPDGLDPAVAASAPTAGGTGLGLIDLLEPLDDQAVLVIGAAGGVGTFTTQFAVNAGAKVIANVNAAAESRMRAYGVTETVIRTQASVKEALGRSHPEGVDVLIDLVSDAKVFASNASLVRPGGRAVTTQYVANLEALQASGICGANFALRVTRDLLERVAQAISGGEILEPPVTRVRLEDVPDMIRTGTHPRAGGKMVIVL